MDLATAQKEIRHAYVRGGLGALISGAVWITAGVVHLVAGVTAGFTVLFFGGMLIFPIGKLLVATCFRRRPESKGNPGGILVLETVFPMIAGLFFAWLFLPHRPDFVFPIAAIAVGAHYYGFRTAYGDWTYWLFATVLCAVGFVAIFFGTPKDHLVPMLVGGIEIGFGIWFLIVDAKESRSAEVEAS